MATTFVPMTAEQFERLPETDRKLELNNGVLVEAEMARAEHEFIKGELALLLTKALPESEFRILSEARNRLGDFIERVPDVAVWRIADLKKMQPQSTIAGGPFVAIEVVSSETAEELDEKIDQYFGAGTQMVWVVYPRTRVVLVARPGGSWARLTSKQTIEVPDTLPGLRIPVANIFALLDQV